MESALAVWNQAANTPLVMPYAKAMPYTLARDSMPSLRLG